MYQSSLLPRRRAVSPNQQRACGLFASVFVARTQSDCCRRFKTTTHGQYPKSFKAYISNVWDNTISGSPYIQDCENRNQTAYFEGSKSFLFSVSKWQNRFFTSIGLMLALYTIVRYKLAGKAAVMSSVVLLYTVVLSGVSCSQGDRFHLVIYPFALLLLGQWALQWRKKKAFN